MSDEIKTHIVRDFDKGTETITHEVPAAFPTQSTCECGAACEVTGYTVTYSHEIPRLLPDQAE